MANSATRFAALLAAACVLSLATAGRHGRATAQEAADAAPAAGQDAPQPKPREIPLGKFVTVFSPIDDGQLARVKTAALALQNEAVNQNRRAVLVLEITPGSSEYHQVYGLARFLSSAELSKVTTVAWIPETVTGHNAIVALACNEIIMHPDAELGDIGRGRALDNEQQQSVLSIVRKVNNLKLDPALAKGMMDPQVAILKLSLGPAADNVTETRVVTQQEAARLRQNKEPILKDEVIWDAGITGKLTGSRARRLGVLITSTAETRRDVADLYNLPDSAMREDPTLDGGTKARLIKVEGMIDPFFDQQIQRQIDRALEADANLLIFEIDSPGGYVQQGMTLANYIADLDPKRVRTVAYIPEKAISAAAFVAFGCREIYMAPDAKIGDAGVMQESDEGGQFEFVPEKILSIVRADLRTLAEKTHRPPALLEAMADKDLKVFQVTHKETGRIWYMSEAEFQAAANEWVKGPVVPESREGNFLILSGRRAHEVGIAGPPVHDLSDLKQRLGIPADNRLVVLERTWIDDLILILNTPVAVFLLFVVGAACLYLELHVNSGFLGIIAALCFGVFFWSKFLGGTAGWLEVLLFVLGVACLGIEIFVVPGFGVFGVSGAFMVLASLVMASQTFGNLEPNSDLQQMTTTVLTMGASVGTVICLALVMNRFLPQMPFFGQMILQPPGMMSNDLDGPRLRPEAADPSQAAESPLMGRTGEVFSDLRPAGRVLIDGEMLDVVSDGPYIARGRQVEVVSVSGNHIVVREA